MIPTARSAIPVLPRARLSHTYNTKDERRECKCKPFLVFSEYYPQTDKRSNYAAASTSDCSGRLGSESFRGAAGGTLFLVLCSLPRDPAPPLQFPSRSLRSLTVSGFPGVVVVRDPADDLADPQSRLLSGAGFAADGRLGGGGPCRMAPQSSRVGSLTDSSAGAGPRLASLHSSASGSLSKVWVASFSSAGGGPRRTSDQLTSWFGCASASSLGGGPLRAPLQPSMSGSLTPRLPCSERGSNGPFLALLQSTS